MVGKWGIYGVVKVKHVFDNVRAMPEERKSHEWTEGDQGMRKSLGEVMGKLLVNCFSRHR